MTIACKISCSPTKEYQKQKLNWFDWLYCRAIENDSFENMVEIVNMSQILDVLWKYTLTMTAMVKSSAQTEPFQVSKGKEICFILL